jgi:hypothetical protein
LHGIDKITTKLVRVLLPVPTKGLADALEVANDSLWANGAGRSILAMTDA